MAKYQVTLNEIIAKTYLIDAMDEDEAVAIAKELDSPADELIDEDWVDYWGDPIVEMRNEVIESPSGWSFRESQENGDRVDCRECGDPLDDDYPIVNDEEGYALHEGCLQTQ